MFENFTQVHSFHERGKPRKEKRCYQARAETNPKKRAFRHFFVDLINEAMKNTLVEINQKLKKINCGNILAETSFGSEITK